MLDSREEEKEEEEEEEELGKVFLTRVTSDGELERPLNPRMRDLSLGERSRAIMRSTNSTPRARAACTPGFSMASLLLSFAEEALAPGAPLREEGVGVALGVGVREGDFGFARERVEKVRLVEAGEKSAVKGVLERRERAVTEAQNRLGGGEGGVGEVALLLVEEAGETPPVVVVSLQAAPLPTLKKTEGKSEVRVEMVAAWSSEKLFPNPPGSTKFGFGGIVARNTRRAPPPPPPLLGAT